ncbi:MAG: metallophosphoesterase family protein [Gaiellales bacterium]
MRTALISDTHGNAVALRAVLDELAQDGIEQAVCLGDVAQGGPEPGACLDLVAGLGCPVVMGNADAFVLDPAAAENEPVSERQLAVRNWTLAQLTPAQQAFMASFRPTVEVDLGDGRTLLAFHGTPRSNEELVFPTTPEAEYRERLGALGHDLVAGGHIHLPYVRRIGAAQFVNPGSVGLGYDHEQDETDLRFDPWAAYAIVTTGAGKLRIELRRTPFDVGAVIRSISESGNPGADELVRGWSPRT